jgi:hypothetical protein
MSGVQIADGPPMTSTFRFIPVAAVVIAAMVASLSAAVRFTSTWKSLDAGAVSFTGKKVAALVISANDSLRVAGEEALARELNARGMQGVATYRIAPKEELLQADTARPWFERTGVEGVVVLRPVSIDTRQRYTPATWVNSSYSSLWGYYGYGWSAVLVPASRRVQTDVIVETTIYSVARNELLWAAVTESTNTRDLPTFVQELVKTSVEVMQAQGLAKAQPR